MSDFKNLIRKLTATLGLTLAGLLEKCGHKCMLVPTSFVSAQLILEDMLVPTVLSGGPCYSGPGGSA